MSLAIDSSVPPPNQGLLTNGFLPPTFSSIPIQSSSSTHPTMDLSFSIIPIQSSSSTHPTMDLSFSIAITTSQARIGDPTTTIFIGNRTATTSTDNGDPNITTSVDVVTLSSVFSTTSVSSPGSQDPTQSSVTAGKSRGPIIGGVIGGIIVVALSAFTAVMIMKRRRRRKQGAPVPTANPLLDNPHVTELAAYSLSKKDPRPFHNHEEVPSANGSSSEIQTQSQIQDQNTLGRSSPGPTLPQSLRDFQTAMQRQMEMMEDVSQRLNLMALGLEAQQREHRDTDSEPPDYESRAST